MDAYAKSKTPKEDRDKRQTPRFLFRRIQHLMNMPIVHDVCAEPHTTKCESFWAEEDDALSIDWMEELSQKNLTQGRSMPYAVWMNPPYSNPEIWCKKAYQESKFGLIIIGLLPDDRSTGWYQDWVEDKAAFIYLPDRRISFEDANCVPQTGNPKGSIVVVWTPMTTNKTCEMRFKI